MSKELRFEAVDENLDGWAVMAGDIYVASIPRYLAQDFPYSEEGLAKLFAAAPEMAKELRNFVNGVETGEIVAVAAVETLGNVTRRSRAILAKINGDNT